MKYGDLIRRNIENSRQRELLKEEKKHQKNDNDGWSEPIRFVKIEEWNHHDSETHQNNICWEMINYSGESIGTIWYTQFSGPFFVENKWIDGILYLKNKTPQNISKISSHEMDDILSHSMFRIKERNGRRLKNRFNLLYSPAKWLLIEELSRLTDDERSKYLDSGGRYVDIKEV